MRRWIYQTWTRRSVEALCRSQHAAVSDQLSEPLAQIWWQHNICPIQWSESAGIVHNQLASHLQGHNGSTFNLINKLNFGNNYWRCGAGGLHVFSLPSMNVWPVLSWARNSNSHVWPMLSSLNTFTIIPNASALFSRFAQNLINICCILGWNCVLWLSR